MRSILTFIFFFKEVQSILYLPAFYFVLFDKVKKNNFIKLALFCTPAKLIEINISL